MNHFPHTKIDTSQIKIQPPSPFHFHKLRALWQEAFGDSDAFLDAFASTAFHPSRCRCLIIHNEIASVLYWFRCQFQGKAVAYIYAVATQKTYQGQGFCHLLLENTHRHLKSLGYHGAILVPGSEPLFAFYEKMGYQTCTFIREIHANCTMHKKTSAKQKFRTCKKGFVIRSISKTEYAKLRRHFLPPDAVLQENENLDFLETQADFFAGEDFLLTASVHAARLNAYELLGNCAQIHNILQTLHCKEGTFRTIGKEQAFAMYYPLQNSSALPKYFAFAFD